MTDRLCGLEKMGVLLGLAASIFYAKALLEKQDEQHFEAQPRHVRHHFLELAIAATRQPAAVTRPIQAPASLLAGSGDGVTRPVSPLFDLAAHLVRTEQARVLAFPDPRD